MQPPRKQKSKTIALLLAVVLGFLGLHNFYMGHNTLGGAKIAINAMGIATSLVPLGTTTVGTLLLLAGSLWIILEMIMIALGVGNMRADRHDVPLKWP